MYQKFKRFLESSSGAFAPMLAICLIPIALSIGIAVDYTSALKARSAIQQALDSAALAAALGASLSEEERIQLAEDTFESNIGASGITVTPTFAITDGMVLATAPYNSANSFGDIVGLDEFPMNVISEIKISENMAAEVVLVLDYSSSMNSADKWEAMRDASIDLVNILGDNGADDDISFGLVPFAKLVRTTMQSDYIIGEPAGGTWTGCTQDRKWPHNTTDATPDTSDPDTMWGLTPSAGGTCHQAEARNLTILPLTNIHSTVIDQLNAMTPHVGTHISLGMEFGWHVISPNAPYSEGVAYDDPENKKFVVLLTDGRQTTKAWGPGGSYQKANGEENLEDMCEAMKLEGINIVTVAFDLDNIPTEERLRDCATTPDLFFNADTNSELTQAFHEMAALFQGEIHISK